jgi:hypothetical protein
VVKSLFSALTRLRHSSRPAWQLAAEWKLWNFKMDPEFFHFYWMPGEKRTISSTALQKDSCSFWFGVSGALIGDRILAVQTFDVLLNLQLLFWWNVDDGGATSG